MKTHSKPHQVMIGRSALLSDSLPWSSDKTGRNPCGPAAIRIRQREFWSIRYHEYTLNAKALMSPESYQQFNGKPAEDLGPVDLARVGRQPAIFVGI